MIIRVPRTFMFPLTALAFVAIPVDYADIVFTTTTRWIFLVALTLYLVAKRRLLAGLQSRFGVALLSYCAWSIATYSWSIIPQLSLEKAVAFSVIAVSFVSAGHEWVSERGSLKALTCLAPITVVALFAALSGHISPGGAGVKNAEAVEGLTDNPNMLASLIVMAMPLLLWTAYRNRATPQMRWIWLALCALSALLLARTYSRSAMLSAGMLGLGFCLSIKPPRSSFILIAIAGAVVVAVAASTPLFDKLYNDYILKGATEDYIRQYSEGTQEGGILYSREGVWEKSYENAKEGGWYGLGYGATAGDATFQGGFTAVGYGREKGNAQLAIVEETGLVGFAFYCLLLATLFTRLVSAFRREPNRDGKVILGIVTGALAGLTVMSIFEAWWVAPGSPESAYFWSLAGVGLAVAQKSRQAAGAAAAVQPFIQAGALPSGAALSERRARG